MTRLFNIMSTQQMEYQSPKLILPFIVSFKLTGTTYEGTSSQFAINRNLKEDKPVEITDDGWIEVNESLIKENEIYPIKYNEELFYIRRNKNAIEIIQFEN